MGSEQRALCCRRHTAARFVILIFPDYPTRTPPIVSLEHRTEWGIVFGAGSRADASRSDWRRRSLLQQLGPALPQTRPLVGAESEAADQWLEPAAAAAAAALFGQERTA
ncbi:unnamed protein product [Arctogadus glacialis]